jgi:hypothetical protein
MTVALEAHWQRWQRHGRTLATAWQWRRECSEGGSSGVSILATASLAAAAAAWRQRIVSSGSTINNQLKVLAATALKMARMTGTTMIWSRMNSELKDIARRCKLKGNTALPGC